MSQSVPKGPYIATLRRSLSTSKNSRSSLNRSQRDRTLQLPWRSGNEPLRGVGVSIGPKGTVHCNKRLETNSRSVFSNVSIGPKGTVHCNVIPARYMPRSAASQSVPKGPYIATEFSYRWHYLLFGVSIGPKGPYIATAYFAIATTISRVNHCQSIACKQSY